ncbi:hypothetical protein NFI96_024617 [Prochilodus magdalenae]|nr:hypothetical protein NFI96_024617 [Prochilodus magdalenae]
MLGRSYPGYESHADSQKAVQITRPIQTIATYHDSARSLIVIGCKFSNDYDAPTLSGLFYKMAHFSGLHPYLLFIHLCIYKEISYSDLKALIKKGEGLVIVDVRTKAEVDKGHIPGSIHIPVSDVENDLSLDPDAFKNKFGVPKPPLNAPHLVFHCQLGRRGEAATEKARSLGFQNARNFVGGYKEWSEKESK